MGKLSKIAVFSRFWIKYAFNLVQLGIFATKHPFMKYTGEFGTLNLMLIPFDERTCVFNNEFVMSDNFQRADNTLGFEDFVASPYPFKIQFNMALFCLGGLMRVRLNLTEYNLRKNDILIVEAGAIGECLEASPDSMIGIIAFSNNYFISESNSEGATLIHQFLSVSSLLPLSDEEMEEFLNIYHQMRQKIRQPDYRYKREILMGYMRVLFCNCCQYMASYLEKRQTSPSSRQDRIFDRFMQLLKEHYVSERNIGFYADKLCLSPKYLSQMVLAASGRHVKDWVRDYVILEAKALLRSRQYTVSQVSDMLNFPNQSFFGVYFKKAVGCSPSAYQSME